PVEAELFELVAEPDVLVPDRRGAVLEPAFHGLAQVAAVHQGDVPVEVELVVVPERNAALHRWIRPLFDAPAPGVPVPGVPPTASSCRGQRSARADRCPRSGPPSGGDGQLEA